MSAPAVQTLISVIASVTFLATNMGLGRSQFVKSDTVEPSNSTGLKMITFLRNWSEKKCIFNLKIAIFPSVPLWLKRIFRGLWTSVVISSELRLDQILQMVTTFRLEVGGMGNVNKLLLGVAPVKNVIILNLLLVVFLCTLFF